MARLSLKLFLFLLLPAACTANNPIGDSLVVTQARRMLHLGGLLGSPTSTKSTPYDRIMGHPVFQVTTPWGSSYMSMERKSGGDDAYAEDTTKTIADKEHGVTRVRDVNEYRTLILFFMDPDDALATHSELKQMASMQDSDIRITAMSLAKALRQSSHLGNGLVTGNPPNDMTGDIKSADDGGILRYKIMPPKRQLYYAARCHGKERVGLFGDTPAADANMVVVGNSALNGMNAMRRQAKSDPKEQRAQAQAQQAGKVNRKTKLQLENAHMEGHVGIPVFYALGMERRHNKLKQLLSGSRREIPLFFNYEDLQTAWTEMKASSGGNNKKNALLPDKPAVEVFNLWDVLTSMDKAQWETKQSKQQLGSSSGSSSTKSKLVDPLLDTLKQPLQQRFGKLPKIANNLNEITFVPSSHCINYKEAISRRGNGKARLRPMR
jgi:hypothetical protein